MNQGLRHNAGKRTARFEKRQDRIQASVTIEEHVARTSNQARDFISELREVSMRGDFPPGVTT
jgi:hypothetical protein